MALLIFLRMFKGNFKVNVINFLSFVLSLVKIRMDVTGECQQKI